MPSDIKKISQRFKYTLGGVIFGILFPIMATILEIRNHGLTFNWASVIDRQSSTPLLWIIDCAPLVIGLFSYQIDRRQVMLASQNENLEELVTVRSREIIQQKLFYEALVENSPIAVVTLDKNQCIVSINPAFSEMFGYQLEEIIGVELDPLVANPEQPQEAFDITRGVLEGRGMHEFGKRKHKDGTLINVEIFGQPIIVNDDMIGVLGMYRDITVEREAQSALRNSEERFRRMFSDSPVAMRMEDLSDIKTWAEAARRNGHEDIRSYLMENRREIPSVLALARIIDLNDASLVLFRAKNKLELQRYLHSVLANESEEAAVEILCQLLEGQTTIERELEYRLPDGAQIYTITKLSIIPGFEETWERVLFSNLDITDRKLAQERLEFISLHDMMTGIYNRAFFEEEMARYERSRNYPISILVADMDNLKHINDRYGHAAGDLALQQMANDIKRCFREDDVIARIGGDEFAVLLPGVDEKLANKAIDRIRLAIVHSNHDNESEEAISISIGMATAQEGDSLAECLQKADAAMYMEKQYKKSNQKN